MSSIGLCWRLALGALLSVFMWLVDPLLGGSVKAGPVEELAQLAVHPADDDSLALRYKYGGDGLLLTNDGGQSWHLMCASAIEGRVRGGSLAIASDGTLFFGTFNGIWASDSAGCNWHPDATIPPEVWVRELVPHPTDPDVLFAVSSTGGGMSNGLYRRTGSGTWSKFGTHHPFLISRLHVVETNAGLRIYQSALKVAADDGGEPEYLMRVSEDGAMTWTDYAFGPAEGQVRLEGVDPSNPDSLLASVDRPEAADSLLVSHDRGQTWSHYATVGALGGVAFAPDGRLWFGDAGGAFDGRASGGLWSATDLHSTPELVTGDDAVNCVKYRPSDGAVLVCLRWSAALFEPLGGTLTEMFDFTTAEAIVSCPGMDMVAACSAQLQRAYCGESHFPQAPLCEPYSDSANVGPTVDNGNMVPDDEDDGPVVDPPPPAAGPEPKTPDAPPPAPDAGVDREPVVIDLGNPTCALAAPPAAGGARSLALAVAACLLLLAHRRRTSRAACDQAKARGALLSEQ